MAELKANITDIEGLVSGIRTANNNTEPSVSSIHDPSQCKGIMISAYVDRIRKISALLTSYKQLMERDADDIIKSKDKIEEMDKSLTNNYK